MHVTLVLPRSLRFPLIILGLVAVFALGCNSAVPIDTRVSMEAHSCVDGALSMSFDVVSSSSILLATYQYGSGNIIPVPTMTGGGNSFHITVDLDTVQTGDLVSMNFSALASPNAAISIQNISFYTVPKSQLPHASACPPEHGPVIATGTAPGIGFHMEVSNQGSDMLVLDQMELAQSPTLLSNADLHWGSPALEGLPWTTPLAPGMPLPPGVPPLIVDLPDIPSPGAQGALVRYVSHSLGGEETRAIVQVDLSNLPVKTAPSTWGAVKALYRDK